MSHFSSPLIVTLASWAFMIALYLSGTISYTGIPFNSAAFAYILACLALYSAGYCVGARSPVIAPGRQNEARRLNDWESLVKRYRGAITVLSICGIIGSALFSIEMIYVLRIDPFDILSLRELYLERQATILSRVAVVIGAGGYISLVTSILCWRYISPHEKFLWTISGFLLAVFSIFSAGRQTLLQLVFIPFLSLAAKRMVEAPALKTWSKRLVFAAFILFSIAYGMVAGYERNAAQLDISKKDMLQTMFDAELAPGLNAALDESPPVIRDGVAEAIFYFSHEIPSFFIFWEAEKPDIFWGSWELPFLARRLHSLGLLSSSVEERMQNVYDQFAESGFPSQVWQTVVRDLILDFGHIGTLCVLGILGYVSARVFRRFKSYGELEVAYLLIGINLCCLYSIMLPAVSDTLVFFYMVFSVIVYFGIKKSSVDGSRTEDVV